MSLGTSKIWHPEKSVILTEDIGDNCTIHAPVWIGKDVHIGNNVKIQAFAFIPDGVTLEDDVFIAPHVCFTNDAKLQVIGKEGWSCTIVRKGAKIGANVTIRAGVTIGINSIVGCGSVCLRDVPAGETWVGNPAVSMVKSCACGSSIGIAIHGKDKCEPALFII